jgi:hypothetical protein
LAQRHMQHNLDEAMRSPRYHIRRAGGAMAHHPILFGMLLSLAIAATVFVLVMWLPGLDAAMTSHGALLDAVYFTGFFWASYMYYFWPLRHIPRFWPRLGGLFLLHVAGVYLYAVYQHPLFVWQWALAGFLEGVAAAVLLRWRTSRPRRGTADSGNR